MTRRTSWSKSDGHFRLEDRVTPVTFTVSLLGDAGIGGSNTGDLRYAIEQALLSPTDDDIVFSLQPGPQTIELNSPLPVLTSGSGALSIDAGTQPGFSGTPVISLAPAISASIDVGFDVQGSDVSITNFSIGGFNVAGIQLGTETGVEPFVPNAFVGSNYLGVADDGVTARPNGNGLLIANGTDGAFISGNLISGNTGAGIRVTGTGSTQMIANRIGVDANGGDLGNQGAGIEVVNGASEVLIGDFTSESSENTIRFNRVGVVVGSSPTDAASAIILDNFISFNDTIGIDLGNDGITPNNSGISPNSGINHPVLTQLINGRIEGFFVGQPLTSYAFEIYATRPGDRRQGDFPVDAFSATTDSNGFVNFSSIVDPQALQPGSTLTATASFFAAGETSEFSPGFVSQLNLISGSNQSTEVNTGFFDPIIIDAVDANGERLPEIDITLVVPPSGPSAILSSGPIFRTDANGRIFTTARANSIVGSYNASASVGNVSVGIPLFNDLPRATSFLVTGLAQVNVGEPRTFTVAAVDSNGNIVTDYQGTIDFSSSDPLAILPEPYTFTFNDGGQRTFQLTFNTPGTQSLIVVDGELQLSATQSATVVAPVRPPITPPVVPPNVPPNVPPGVPPIISPSERRFPFSNLVVVSGVHNGELLVFSAVPGTGKLVELTRLKPFGNVLEFFDLTDSNADSAVPIDLVRGTSADVDGNGVEDLIYYRGAGAVSDVLVLLRNADGTVMQTISTTIFESSFVGGIDLYAADIDGDGRAEVVVGAEQGGGPRVKVLRFVNGSFVTIADFFAIDDTSFRGGVRVALGDVNGDGILDLVAAAGIGGGPRIAIFDGVSILQNNPVKLTPDFFAFEATQRDGAYIAIGDFNNDGFADLIFGGGPGGGPRVLGVDGRQLLTNTFTPLFNFFAGNPNSRGGIRVAIKNLDGDLTPDLVAGSGDRSQALLIAALNNGGFFSNDDIAALAPMTLQTFLGVSLMQGITTPSEVLSPFGTGSDLGSVFVG